MRMWLLMPVAVSLCGTCFGQVAGPARGSALLQGTTPTAPEFEVVLIKPSERDARSSDLNFDPGRIVAKNLTLRSLLQYAYHLSSGSNDQLVGGPSWVSSAPFDMSAKEDEATAKQMEAMPPEQESRIQREMMQRLLADRFQLKVHRETRQLPVDALEVAKGGSKMIPTATATATATAADSATKPRWGGLHHSEHGHIEGRDATVEMLTGMLATLTEVGGRLVVDRTGLEGRYDFDLRWSPDDGVCGAQSGSGAGSGPSLFAAMEEQLGLKVVARRAPVAVVVIDHVEKPSEN